MIANVDPMATKRASPGCQLKVVLLGSKPSIWRMLQVPGHANLGWLHAVLQTAMGWANSHLHQFVTRDARYSDPRCNKDLGFGDESDRDEAKATVLEVAPEKGARFIYEYDFGDSWEHEITVEQVVASVMGKTAVCVDGAGACPPEDCGGVWGYANLLKVLKNPKHPEHKSMKQWVGGSIDPNAFDHAEINRWLSQLKWPRVTEAHLRKVLMGRDRYVEE